MNVYESHIGTFNLNRSFVLVILCLFVHAFSFAQKEPKVLTLEACQRLAVSNDFTFKELQLRETIGNITLEQSKKEKYPSLDGSYFQGFNLGRNIDPFSNQFVTTPINSANLGLNSNLTIYNGGQVKNTIELNKLSKNAIQFETASNELEIKQNVALAYLDILLKKDILKLKAEQVTIIEKQIERWATMNKFGNEAASTLIDLNAQLQNEKYAYTESENELKLAKVKLANILQRDINFDVIEPDNLKIADVQSLQNPSLIWTPMLRLRQNELEQARVNLKLKEAARKPFIFLSGGLFSNYSSLAPDRLRVLDGDPSTNIVALPDQFVDIAGQQFPVNRVVVAPLTEQLPFGYFSQMVGNIGLSIKLNVQLPIYDKGYAKSQIDTQNIQRLIAQNNYNKTKQEIEAKILEYQQYAENSYNQMKQAEELISVQNEAFKLAKMRFEENIIRLAEFNQAKIQLEAANSTAIRNKYNYYFYKLMINYFLNN